MRPTLTTLAALGAFARAGPVRVQQELGFNSHDDAQQGALLPPEGDALEGDLERERRTGTSSSGGSLALGDYDDPVSCHQ